MDFNVNVNVKLDASSYLKDALGHIHRIRDLGARIEVARKGI